MRVYLKIFLILFSSFVITSCKENKDQASGSSETSDFSLRNVKLADNFKSAEKSEKHFAIDLDYTEAIDSGFIIPSINQSKDGFLNIEFEIRNKKNSPASFFYKIYYQNETYKFPELDTNTGKEHMYADENFYGSWENTHTKFKEISAIPNDGDFHVIKDRIRIVGNPRNDSSFFSDGKNQRWQRNPRVGSYCFLVVVSSEDPTKAGVPMEIQDISMKNGGKYSNPFYFFLHGKGPSSEKLLAKKAEETLTVRARPNLGAGIYVDPFFYDDNKVKVSYNKNCSMGADMYKKAPFQQFVHHIDSSTRMANIPVIKDVIKDNYTKAEYNWNKQFYSKEELILTTATTAEYPCQSVFSDQVRNKIIIRNPKSEYGNWKKENVGIKSRHGFTFGKYRIKAKMTELLNKSNVWNGITNAIWLIYQPGPWNLRRICTKEGYMKEYFGKGQGDPRVPSTIYSEIDFEILKTPPYCPSYQFPPVFKNPTPSQYSIDEWNTPSPAEIQETDDMINVACTNWDMACWQPEKFGVGCQPIEYQGKHFEAHRWDHWYRALTEKDLAKDDELFGSDHYYFEIDWRPTEIIWRIGPSPDKMRVVGYMNDKITSIPNNQMLLIVTQEFHNTRWWPGSPYAQENTPFPRNDIVGEILEVTIE